MTSERRSSSGSPSPSQMEDFKQKSTVTEPVWDFTFCQKSVFSEVDKIFYNFRSCHSRTNVLFKAPSVKFMEVRILENPGFVAFFATAKLRMKAFLEFVEEGVQLSSEDETSLLREVWLDPCFFGSLAAAIHYDDDIVHLILGYLDDFTLVDVADAEPIDRMKADPNFMDSVRGLRKRISVGTFIRLFLSIVLGFWGNEVSIRELDQKMGIKKQFGWRLDRIAKAKARKIERAKIERAKIERAGKEDEIEDFSYVIEDISHANDMEPLRNLMLEKYDGREDRDIEALLEKIDLSFLLSISYNHLGYGGRKMEICVQVINGCYCGIISMTALPSNA